MYGSPLWQLDSEEHQKLNRSWNTAIKMVWNLRYPTHTRLLEDLCPVRHLEHSLYTRYISFVQSLYCSKKDVLKLLFRNSVGGLNSVIGRNIHYLCQKFRFRNLDEMFRGKPHLNQSRVHSLAEDEKWKPPLIKELALLKKNFLTIDFDEEHLTEILDHVCTQ